MYEILTEDTNRTNITRTLDSHFPQGYTLIPASGHWQGISEPSIVVQIETTNVAAVYAVAREIREANHQSAVLVEDIPSLASLVGETTPEMAASVTNAVGEQAEPHFVPVPEWNGEVGYR